MANSKSPKKPLIKECSFCCRAFEVLDGRHKERHFCSPDCAHRYKHDVQIIELPSWAISLLSDARKRAKKKGLAFQLDEKAMSDLIRRSKWRCELSGIPFSYESPTQRGPHRPYAPSLDRIDCSIGYTVENTRLVALAVNIAMNQWGEEVLRAIASGLTGIASTTDGFAPRAKRRGKNLPGVRIISKSRIGVRYQARIGNASLGFFDSETAAHSAYLKAKSDAQKSRQVLPKLG